MIEKVRIEEKHKERFYKLGLKVADHVGAMLAYWDTDEVCKYANNAFSEWFGKTRDEMMGISLSTLLGSMYESNLPYIAGVLEGHKQVFEREIPVPSGDTRIYLATYYPDISEGTVQGFYVHAADITTIKKLEHELRSSEMMFRGLLESAPDAMIIVNEKGFIQLVNHQCMAMFGYSREELIGRPNEMLVAERFKTLYLAKRASYFLRDKARKKPGGIEMYGRRKNGDEFPVEIRLSPLETDEGLLVSIAIRDISWMIEKEKELQQSVDVISDQNKRLLNFAHIVSHNLRSHSGNLESVLKLMKEAENEETKEDMIGYLNQISEGFTETVNHLNEIVAMQEAKKNLQKEKINLHSFMERSLVTLVMDIRKAGAKIRNNIPPDMELWYSPAYMESIMLNFMTNAIKYRQPGRVAEVDVNAYYLDTWLIMEIKDNGIGIDLEKNGDKLFGMYSTFHNNPDARGVGLFITKYQVEAMGGHIEVDSKPGEGTTFRIYFTMKKADVI